MWPDLYTMAIAYQQIVKGERPWTALGDFMNYWFGYATEQREALVKETITEPEQATPEQHQWAAFCAAAVEYLCLKYALTCPAWVENPTYLLADPWFKGLGAHKPHVQARLRLETPEPFTRRNIFCGDRIFANKYELATEVYSRRSA